MVHSTGRSLARRGALPWPSAATGVSLMFACVCPCPPRYCSPPKGPPILCILVPCTTQGAAETTVRAAAERVDRGADQNAVDAVSARGAVAGRGGGTVQGGGAGRARGLRARDWRTVAGALGGPACGGWEGRISGLGPWALLGAGGA